MELHAVCIEVSEREAGERVDVVLVHHVEGMSRAKARGLAAEGCVRINGRRAKKGQRVAAGDRVTLDVLPAPSDFVAEPDPLLPLCVLHEDASLVAVDKPAGVPTHPLRPGETGTLAGALVARWPEMARVGYSRREPGIVHRLDTDTSGVVLAARDTESFERLRRDLSEGRMDKRYLALCQGRVEAPEVVEVPLASDPADARRVVACPDPERARRLRARPGRTVIVSSEAMGAFSLVEVRAQRAGRHQVRAHLAFLGHPLAGDALYGGPPVPGLGRHFLHASRVTLRHPTTGAELYIEAALPDDLAAAVDRLRASG